MANKSCFKLFEQLKRIVKRGPSSNFNFSESISLLSNIESDNSQNFGLEDYNNISVGIFPCFTTPSIKITLGQKEFEDSFKF